MHVQSCCFAYRTYCFFFLRSRCRPRRWILKSLQVHVQKLSLMQHRGCGGSLYNPDSGSQVALN